jgi:hypothetical protein
LGQYVSDRILLLKYLVASVVLSIPLTFATELFQNQPVMGLSENYYGWPVAWRTTFHGVNMDFMLTNLLIDITFWTVILFPAIFILNGVIHF